MKRKSAHLYASAILLAACSRGGTDAAPLPNADSAAASVPQQSPTLECGSSAIIQVTLKGASGASSQWHVVSLEPAALFQITGPIEGQLAPGDSMVLPVRASVSGGLATNVEVHGVLTVAIDGEFRTLPVAFTPTGNYVTASDTVLDFGTAPVAFGPRSETLTFENHGEREAHVHIAGVGSPFEVEASDVVVPAAGRTNVDFLYRPQAAENISRPLSVIVDGPACGPAPVLTLRASASGASLGLDRTNLDFGAVGCGMRGTSREVRLTNYGSSAVAWTASLARGSGSPYEIRSNRGAILAGANETVTVIPRVVDAAFVGDLDDELIIESDAGQAMHVLLHELVAEPVLWVDDGLVVAFDPTQLTHRSAPKSINVRNRGATQVDVSVASGEFASDAPLTIPAGGSSNVSVQFAPIDLGKRSAALSFASTPSACGMSSGATLQGSGFARATSLSGAGYGLAALVDGGHVAVGLGYGSAKLLDQKLVATSVVRTDGDDAFACAVRMDGTTGCWADPSAPHYVGAIPAISAATWPYLLEPNGQVDIDRFNLLQPFTNGVRAIGTGAVVVFEDGHVETWSRMLETGTASDMYPQSRTAWPAWPPVKLAFGVPSEGCGWLDDGSVRCTTFGTGAPQPITGLSTITALANHCALRDNGNVACWGATNGGFVGGTDAFTAVDIGVSNAVDIVPLGSQSAVLLGDGRVVSIDLTETQTKWVAPVGGLE